MVREPQFYLQRTKKPKKRVLNAFIGFEFCLPLSTSRLGVEKQLFDFMSLYGVSEPGSKSAITRQERV